MLTIRFLRSSSALFNGLSKAVMPRMLSDKAQPTPPAVPNLGTVIKVDDIPKMTPQQYAMTMIQLQTLSKCISLLVDCNIANNIPSKGEPINVAELAKSLKHSEANLRRILNFASSHGFYTKVADGKYLGTPYSDILRDDMPGNVAGLFRFYFDRKIQTAFHEMAISLRSGKPTFDIVHGRPMYQYLAENPELEKQFDSGVANFFAPLQDLVINSEFNFSPYSRLVEVAGGKGGLLAKILRKYPNIHSGTLFERPSVLPNVLPELETGDLKNRFHKVAGNAFVSVHGVEGDLFLIANTLRNFNDDGAMKMLTNIANAMKRSEKKGFTPVRLLVVEGDMIINNDPECDPSVMRRGVDMFMMFLLEGKARTSENWEKLFIKSGLELVKKFKISHSSIGFECKLEDSPTLP